MGTQERTQQDDFFMRKEKKSRNFGVKRPKRASLSFLLPHTPKYHSPEFTLGVGPKPSCLHWIFRSPNFMTRRNRKHISLNHVSLFPSHRREKSQTKHCEGFPANLLSEIRTLPSAFLPASGSLGPSSFRWIIESKHGCTLGTSFSLRDVAW